MSQSEDGNEWIFRASRERLVAELERRNLPTDGPDSVLAFRLLRRTDFLTCLGALFDRLSPPWSEEEKISYAHRHMLPRLQTMVHRDAAEDLETLELLAARAESCYRAAQSYRALPPPEGSLIPDLAYRPPKGGGRRPGGKANDTVAVLQESSENASKGRKAKARKPRAGVAETAVAVAASTSALSGARRTKGK
ncbi:hypothetical protein DBV15_12895, partial [Temnothorax longispinosus]